MHGLLFFKKLFVKFVLMLTRFTKHIRDEGGREEERPAYERSRGDGDDTLWLRLGRYFSRTGRGWSFKG